MASPRSARGFTLIELMVVVGIIGILASVAIPVFEKALLRTKVTERATITLRIKQAIQDYYVRNGRLLPPSSGGSLLSGYNPPFPPTSQRRMMATDLAAWNVYFSGPGGVVGEIEGALYYSYAFRVDDPDDAPATIVVWAVGDLDGDAAYAYKYMTWNGENGVFQLDSDSEYPRPGFEDDHGPYATF